MYNLSTKFNMKNQLSIDLIPQTILGLTLNAINFASFVYLFDSSLPTNFIISIIFFCTSYFQF